MFNLTKLNAMLDKLIWTWPFWLGVFGGIFGGIFGWFIYLYFLLINSIFIITTYDLKF